jgi:hypothetical protein
MAFMVPGGDASLADTQHVVTGCARQRASFSERSLGKRPRHYSSGSCFFATIPNAQAFCHRGHSAAQPQPNGNGFNRKERRVPSTATSATQRALDCFSALFAISAVQMFSDWAGHEKMHAAKQHTRR